MALSPARSTQPGSPLQVHLGSGLWGQGQASMGLTVLWPDSYQRQASTLFHGPSALCNRPPNIELLPKSLVESAGPGPCQEAGPTQAVRAPGSLRTSWLSMLCLFCTKRRLLAPTWRFSAWEGCQDPGSGSYEWPVWAQGLCHVSWWWPKCKDSGLTPISP